MSACPTPAASAVRWPVRSARRVEMLITDVLAVSAPIVGEWHAGLPPRSVIRAAPGYYRSHGVRPRRIVQALKGPPTSSG